MTAISVAFLICIGGCAVSAAAAAARGNNGSEPLSLEEVNALPFGFEFRAFEAKANIEPSKFGCTRNYHFSYSAEIPISQTAAELTALGLHTPYHVLEYIRSRRAMLGDLNVELYEKPHRDLQFSRVEWAGAGRGWPTQCMSEKRDHMPMSDLVLIGFNRKSGAPAFRSAIRHINFVTKKITDHDTMQDFCRPERVLPTHKADWQGREVSTRLPVRALRELDRQVASGEMSPAKGDFFVKRAQRVQWNDDDQRAWDYFQATTAPELLQQRCEMSPAEYRRIVRQMSDEDTGVIQLCGNTIEYEFTPDFNLKAFGTFLHASATFFMAVLESAVDIGAALKKGDLSKVYGGVYGLEAATIKYAGACAHAAANGGCLIS